MEGVGTAKDYFGPGIDALDTQRIDYYGKCVYWPLKGVKAGKYYVGLWAQSNDPYYRTEYSPGRFLATIYLNGWPVRFATTSDPVQVKPGLWLAELQTPAAIDLKEGDEIALAGSARGQIPAPVPVQGRARARARRDGADLGHPRPALSQVQLAVQAQIVGTGLDGDEHNARITIGNPLPYTARIDAELCLADYFGKPLVNETTPVTVEPHKTVIISRKFKAVGTDLAYQLNVKTRPSAFYNDDIDLPGIFQASRPLEMVPLNAFARLGFLPGRPGSLDVWQHTRLELSRNQTGDRKLLSLDGDGWQSAPLTTRRVPDAVPEKLDFQQTYVPYRAQDGTPRGRVRPVVSQDL